MGPLSVVIVVILLPILAVLGWWLLKRRRQSSIRDAIAAVAIERIDDVVVPDGMGGEIHIEHLLLTTRGILVINVKRYEGVIFASDRMDQWTAIDPKGRSVFPNPLGNLYDRVAAVKQLARDVDVSGFLLFPAAADFSKGRPESVLQPDDLLQTFAMPDKGDKDRLTKAFAPYWERVRQAAKPAEL